MFTIGQQVRYVEFMEGGDVKRFVFPVEESLIGKINSLSKIPELSIVNMGTGSISEVIVNSAPGRTNTLKSVPSGVNDIFTVQFHNHPDITHGTARFSHELIDYMTNNEIEVKVPVMASSAEFGQEIGIPAPVQTLSLTEQLKQQIKGPDVNPGQMTLDDYPEVKNKVVKLPSLEEKVAEAKKQKGANKLPTDVIPSGALVVSEDLAAHIVETLRIVKAIDRSYNGEQKEVSGRDLARWFNEHAYEDGTDKAWDYIASKVSDW